MKRKNKYRIIIVYFTISLLMLTGCYRHNDRWHSSEKNSDRLTNYIAKELELNEGQKTELNMTITNLMTKREEILKDNLLRDEIFNQLSSEKINEASLSAIISIQMKEIEVLAKSFVINLTEFHRTLTPEQKKKFASLMEMYQDRGSKHRRTYSYK
ncbi:MAG: Spy/CpxP family protein refolding chaperone [Deltaproteobacteria bacterium]|jgi:Spy/CpxP family protein refolding chaperone|nr:Spy/CpxP family protein refolding chaperone [Deltaproteobacteria bacterium]